MDAIRDYSSGSTEVNHPPRIVEFLFVCHCTGDSESYTK